MKPLKRYFAPGSAPPKKYWDVWLWPTAGVSGVIALILGLLSNSTAHMSNAISYFIAMLPFALIALLSGIGGLISSSQRFFRM